MLHTKNQQQIRIRLTSPSNAMGYDPRYICHCYDIMANLYASRNDTRLVINRDLTVSQNKNSNLGIKGSVDSSILGSIDSKNMVKNICTSHKYISWYYFLTFTENQSRNFGTKVIRQWFKKKVVRIQIQNITNCYIVIKRNRCFIKSSLFQVNVMSMGGSLKYISSLSHKNSKKSEQKCEGRIFQKGVSIKFCKYCTFSYYSRR